MSLWTGKMFERFMKVKMFLIVFTVHQMVLMGASRSVSVASESGQYNASDIDASQGVVVPEDEEATLQLTEERVNVEEGALRGVLMRSKDNSSFFGFLGVPYAKPPLGDLRFKAPQPAQPWKEDLIANRRNIVCMQRNLITKEIEGTEDCLVLHVYTAKLPSGPSDPLLPVMVWIHGGGFEVGSGNSDIYGPDYFVVQGIVLVSINYRLGPLGFMNLKDASVSANVGLKDQVAALKWVKKNIASFGGDSNQVTIFGQSAGAACVHYHMLSPMSKGLFHRAISQSGSSLHPWAYSKAGHSRAVLLGHTLGCAASNTSATAQCLRTVSGYDLVAHAHNHTISTEDERHYIRFPFVPTSEAGYDSHDVFLPGEPIDLMTAGKFHRDVPYVTGVNSLEAAFFVPKPLARSLLKEFNGEFERLIPADVQLKDRKQREYFAKRMKRFYFGKEDVSEATLDRFIYMLTDLFFTMGTLKTVEIHTKFSTAQTFLYQFSFDGSLGFAKRLVSQTEIPGAVHSDDLGYMFKVSFWDINLTPESPEMKTLSRMVNMWTNFAKHGNPSSAWTPVTSKQQSYLSIDKEMRMRVDMEQERMAFWDEMYLDAEQGLNEVDSDDEADDADSRRSSSGATCGSWREMALTVALIAVSVQYVNYSLF